MTSSINKWSRADLLQLPRRCWSAESEYESVLLLSTRRRHAGSGWAIMAIIGVNDAAPTEVACICADDIAWAMPAGLPPLRTDCALRSGAIHIRAPEYRFRVGVALSSTCISVLPRLGASQ